LSRTQDLTRKAAKNAQWWLRKDRRVERILHRATRLRGEQTLYSHEIIVPMTSTYSPWHDDTAFRAVYDCIGENTFVDQYKCYELWEQLGQLTHVDGDILEVGVWRGGTGTLMATRAAALGLDTTVFLADTFQGVAKAGDADPWYRGGEHADTSPEIVRALAAQLGVEVEILVGMFPDQTAHQIEDRRFRLVHIDVDVYDSARDVLEWSWPRLATGGVIIWDDYGAFECEGVATLGRQLFDLQMNAGRLVHNVNGHLLLFKLSDGDLPPISEARPRGE
jgi:O-methyltransferase